MPLFDRGARRLQPVRTIMTFSIERARPDQVDALCAIERAAVQLFRGHPAWRSYVAASIPPEQLYDAIARGMVWTASVRGAPVGFLWLDDRLPEPAIGIAELDVLPEHGRQGIGAALLEHAWQLAGAGRWTDFERCRAVLLTLLPRLAPMDRRFFQREIEGAGAPAPH